MEPTKASDKRIVNGKGDINQLMPLRYEWAWPEPYPGAEDCIS